MISQLYIDLGRDTLTNADALSRLPCQPCGQQQHKSEGEAAQVNIVTGNIHTLVGRSLQELKDLQVQDTHIGPVLCCLEKGEQPDTNSSRSLPRIPDV